MSATPPPQAGTLLSADHRESGSRTTSTTVNPSILMTNTLPVTVTALKSSAVTISPMTLASGESRRG